MRRAFALSADLIDPERALLRRASRARASAPTGACAPARLHCESSRENGPAGRNGERKTPGPASAETLPFRRQPGRGACGSVSRCRQPSARRPPPVCVCLCFGVSVCECVCVPDARTHTHDEREGPGRDDETRGGSEMGRRGEGLRCRVARGKGVGGRCGASVVPGLSRRPVPSLSFRSELSQCPLLLPSAALFIAPRPPSSLSPNCLFARLSSEDCACVPNLRVPPGCFVPPRTPTHASE